MMIIMLISFQKTYKAQAQEVGVGDVIFEEATLSANNILMNELSYNVIKLHITIAGKNIETANYEGETLATIKKLEELTKTDIIEVLNISVNKQDALAKYLNESSQTLEKWDTIAVYMKQEMVFLQADMQSCLIEKNISDKAYFDAIDRYDQSIMQTSLTDSITYEICATKNRIQYNALAGVANKLVFYLGLLQKKYDILFAKQDILAKNFEIFRDGILPDLNQIDDLLQQYKF